MYLTDLVVILDRNFDHADVIQHNINNAGKKCRLLVFNNGCINPDQELLDQASVYIDNQSPVEKSYAECVNELLPNCSGNFVVFFHHFAYYSDNWLELLIDAHCKNFNSGAISITSDPLTWTFVLSDEDLKGVFEGNDKNSGMFLISQDILKAVGLFDVVLKDVSAFWHYQERIKLLGYNNYALPDTWCIEMGVYQSNYATSKVFYKKHLRKTIVEKNIFIPIRSMDLIDHRIVVEIKNRLDCSIEFSQRLGCLVCILPKLNQCDLDTISEVCKNFKKTLEIIPSSYFDELLLKNSLLVLIK